MYEGDAAARNIDILATIKNKQIGKIILQLQQHHP